MGVSDKMNRIIYILSFIGKASYKLSTDEQVIRTIAGIFG